MRDEKYEITNVVVYNLNGFTYLIAQCETNTFFFTEKQVGQGMSHRSQRIK